MAYFALLWKAQTIEKYRLNYEKEKIRSVLRQNQDVPKRNICERWSYYKHSTKKRMAKRLRQCFPEGSKLSNFIICLRTDQTIPNFVWKSFLGFVGGIVLTYLCFLFFVFQLAISLIHATIMSSVIGVLLTLGLAFSYRARCLVFLLVPQFFSRVGRYTLTCYALVLILTGPATNTLKNSEVLSESMACSQEQLKSSLTQIKESAEKPFNSMKETIKVMIDRIRQTALTMKETFMNIHVLGMHIASVFQTSFSWLNSVVDTCNKKLGTPYDRCIKAIEEGVKDCKAKLDVSTAWACHPLQIGYAVCETFKPLRFVCAGADYMKGPVVDTVKRKFQSYSEHISTMLFISIHVHHSYSFSSNSSHSASQVAAGIVTEIRSKADPMLTWISWSSCVTSTFLLLIIFRAKHYQAMFETRSRFDNRYVTQELRDLDLRRVRQGRESVLPLNARESAKYVTTTSFRLVASEKLYLARSAVFTAITTFKLLIHMVADYSLYWVLMTIRYHGRFQSPWKVGPDDQAMKVVGEGAVASILRAIVEALSFPLHAPMPDPVACLPDPYPPDFHRYTQIGVLILLLWFFALLEPYGLRLRHKIMSLYSPARARARAAWLYNHILRTRGSFLKYARRKLHRIYKYSGDEKLTFRYWVDTHIPFAFLRYLLGNRQIYPQCVLCGITNQGDSKVEFIRCEISNCPGLYCSICFNDISKLCTICLSPVDYGDLSDVSLEKGSSESSDDDSNQDFVHDTTVAINDQDASPSTLGADDSESSPDPKFLNKSKSMWFSAGKAKEKLQEEIELLADYKKSKTTNESTPDMLQNELKKAITKRVMQTRNRNPALNGLTNHGKPTKLKNNKTIHFKICNNPMVYTALVSYDNPTQSNNRGFCKNRAKIKEALNDLSARRHSAHMCEHTSLWLKHSTKKRFSRSRKRNINFNFFKDSKKLRTRPARDLTAFMSNFYNIQREGIRFSIAKIYSTSKIGKILRRNFKVIRRRRAKKKSPSCSFYNMFSRNKRYAKIKHDKRHGRISNDPHDLAEVIVTSPHNSTDQEATQRPVNWKRKNEKKRVQRTNYSIKRYSPGAESTKIPPKSKGAISDLFLNPIAIFFNHTTNVPPLENRTNYKRRKKIKNSLSEFFGIKRNTESPTTFTELLNDSECPNVTQNLDMVPQNVKQGTADIFYSDSASEISTKSLSSKPISFKKSINSVKNYCSHIAHAQKNKSKNPVQEKGITRKPTLKSATTQCLEAGKPFSTKKGAYCCCDAKVDAMKETCSCGVQYTQPNDTKSYTETTTSFNSSTDTLKHQSVHSRDTVTYEYEDPRSVKFSNYSLIKKRKSNSAQIDHKSTETTSTITTANATTATNDWWSPIVERKKISSLEKRSLGNSTRVTAKRKSWNVAKLNLKSSLASTDTKLVSFRSKAEIIPPGILPIRELNLAQCLLKKEQQHGNKVFNARNSTALSTNRERALEKPNRSVLKGAHIKSTKMKRLIWQPAR